MGEPAVAEASFTTTSHHFNVPTSPQTLLCPQKSLPVSASLKTKGSPNVQAVIPLELLDSDGVRWVPGHGVEWKQHSVDELLPSN